MIVVDRELGVAVTLVFDVGVLYPDSEGDMPPRGDGRTDEQDREQPAPHRQQAAEQRNRAGTC